MRQDIIDIPDHLRDALWRADTARLEPGEADLLLVCGVGGSAIGGDLAAAVLGPRLDRPMFTVRGYSLPSWVDQRATVLCSSFSGGTEETLACFEAASELGCRRVVASTGGQLTAAARQSGVPVIGLPGIIEAPRAAVAYMVVVALEVAAASGIAPRMRAEIEAAAAELADLRGELEAQAGEIAAAIGPAIPVVYGAGLTTPVARRWKGQINENAKRPAFFSQLPEANHNEICAWGIGEGMPSPEAPQAAILLGDAEQHPRERLRLDLTAELIAAAGRPAVRVETRGESRLARLMSAVMIGDFLSLALAERDGVEPAPIPAIDRLKERLV